MKSVLLSIRPVWCEKIADGKKTIEVRKTRPKLETPFKCYIYCTSGGKLLAHAINAELYLVNGKVIGEFVCDNVKVIFDTNGNPKNYMTDILPSILQKTALSYDEFGAYVGSRADKNSIYGWHISDLKIYDEPKELCEFKKINRDCWYADLGFAKRDCSDCKDPGCFLKRPPQSWCYVEELQ